MTYTTVIVCFLRIVKAWQMYKKSAVREMFSVWEVAYFDQINY